MTQLTARYYAAERQLQTLCKHLDGLPSLALRLYLVPVLWMAGSQKIDGATFMPYQSTIDWFGNPEWGLGLPLPALMAFLAGWTELLGAIFLAVGILVRWITIPLLVTMVVAAFAVHIDYGWQAIADPSAPFASARVMESAERLAAARDILKEHGNYSWLTGRGSLVILNNGIEFAATYFVMLLALLPLGGGRYVSLDYWLNRWLGRRQ